MKGMKYNAIFGIALVCGILFAACTINDSLEDGYGRISVNFEDWEDEPAVSQTARSVFPSRVFDKYVYTFTRAGGQDGVVKTPDTDGFFIMEVGDYTVAVQAYIGSEEPYTLAASGVSAQFSVGPGYNTPVRVLLSMADSGAQGIFNYTINYPAGAVADVTLRQWPGMDDIALTPANQGNGVTETLELEAGSYVLSVHIYKTGLYTGISDSVHIYSSCSTVYVKNFSADDFVDIIPPMLDDYIVSGTGTFTYDGGAKTASITRTETASTGAITVLYNGLNGSANEPVNVGTYTVTFNVEAADRWMAASGLPAGTISITKAAGAAVNAPSEISSRTATSITINPVDPPGNGQTVQYARNTTNTAPSVGWQDGTTFTYLTAGTTYYFFARSVQNSNYEYGEPSAGYEVRPEYVIALSPNTVSFTSAAYGYEPQVQTLTVSNAGNNPTGTLTVALSGTNADKFTLSTESISSIGYDGNASFTIGPIPGLDAGSYSATVTVSGANITSISRNFSFAVIRAAGAVVSAPSGTSSISTTSITLNPVIASTGQEVQYAMNTTNTAPSTGWQDSTTFTLTANISYYYFFARAAQNTNYNQGTVSGSYQVKPIYGISLSPATVTFSSATYGYGSQTPQTITVSNIGSNATGQLTVALSGTGAASFTLSKASINSLAVNGTDSFTVVPNTGLNGGTHYATVTVSGANIISVYRSISFTVNRANGVTVSAPSGTSSISPTSITLSPVTASNGQPVQYAMNTTNTAPSSGWQSNTAFSGLTPNTVYYFFARAAENTNYYQGTASAGYSVRTAKPDYEISVSPATITVPSATWNYGAQTAQTVTVSNTGSNPTGQLTVALSGTDASRFTLSAASINSIAVNGTASFTVVPNTGLDVGTYSATITVSGSNVTSVSLSVSFTVNVPNQINIANNDDWNRALGWVRRGGSGTSSAKKNYNFNITGSFSVSGQTVNNDSAGFGRNTNIVITLGGTGMLTLNSAGKLAFINSSQRLIIDGATLRGMSSGNASNRVLEVLSGGTLELTSGTIGSNNGGGVLVNSGGTFTMSGGMISGNTNSTDNGGGVHNSGTFTMSGGSITGNNTQNRGAGVYNNGTFYMADGSIYNNHAYDRGGGVYNNAGFTFTMYGGTISGNSANGPEGTGGGICNAGTFRMVNGTVYGTNVVPPADTGLRNTAAYQGAALGAIQGNTSVRGTGSFSSLSFSSLGTLTAGNNTIRVVNGVVQ